jgi:hypothetical protein
MIDIFNVPTAAKAKIAVAATSKQAFSVARIATLSPCSSFAINPPKRVVGLDGAIGEWACPDSLSLFAFLC